MISLMLPIEGVPKGRPRFFNGYAVTPEATRRFERDLARLVRSQYAGGPVAGPLKLTLTFVFVRPKSQGTYRNKLWRPFPSSAPDIDNYAKAVMDACNGVLWADDGQIVGLSAWKVYGPSPHITLTVTDAQHEQFQTKPDNH